MANETIELLGMLAALLKRNILSTAILASIGVAVNADAQTICAPIQANSIEPNKLRRHVMDQAELEARGKALRQEIDAKYRELEAPGGVFYSPQGVFYSPPNNKEGVRRADVTGLVLKYIPIGMPFKDVMTVLRSGGFDPKPTGPGSEFDKRLPVPDKDAGIIGGLRLVADMRWFTGFGISVHSDSPKGSCVSMLYADFQKQMH